MKKARKMVKKTQNKKQRNAKVISLIVFILLLFGLAVSIFAIRQKTQENTSAATTFVGLHAVGNKIETQAGQQIYLRGVSTSGTETGCVGGGGAYGGNPANQAEITAMKTWNINAVRVPLNESCWLGLAGNPSGTAYQTAIETYVKLITSNGMAAIVDLHWNKPNCTNSCQDNMADSAHSPAFWTSVAGAFKNNGSVVFELYNEPHDISWDCWKNGCDGWAGMQTLLNDVRGAGATNLVLMGGVSWSDDLSGWLANKPTDPLNDIGAAWHSYNFNACNNESCWNSQVKPVADSVPVVGTEIGETDCSGTYVKSVFNWLDSINQNYTGWAWFAGGGCGFPSLINDWSGTPTAEGQSLKDILTGLAAQPVPADQQANPATTQTSPNPKVSPTMEEITPTFGIVGDCTTNGTCPSISPSVSGTVSVTLSQAPNPSSTPSGTPQGGNSNFTSLLLQLIVALLDFLKLLFGGH